MLSSDGLPWLAQANCLGADPSIFILARGDSNRAAKAICQVCDVRVECLQHALDNQESGIWGMTSDRERRYVRNVGYSALEYLTGVDNGSIRPPGRGRPKTNPPPR